MKSRKNGSASIATRGRREQRHVRILKSGRRNYGRKDGGREKKKGRRTTQSIKAAKMGKVLRRGRKRESGNDDATMSVGSFRLFSSSPSFSLFHHLFILFLLLLHLILLHSSRSKIKVSSRNFKRNYSLAAFHLHFICHVEQTHVNTLADDQPGQPIR